MIVVTHPPGREPERRYALDVVLGTVLGLDYEARPAPRADVLMSVAGEDGALRLPDLLLGCAEEAWLTPASLPRLSAAGPGGIPLLYSQTAPAGGLAAGEKWLEADVFGGAFFMLTRYEELVARGTDEHGRFPSEESIAVRFGFLRRPVVHEHAELLWSRVSALWPRLERGRAGGSAVLPSHDVDWPFLPLQPPPALARTMAGDLLRRRDPGLASRRLRWQVARRRGTLARDPFDTFDELMDISEEAGVRSAFYFMAGSADGPLHAGYSPDDPRVRAAMSRIHERGHEIGLHPSYGSFRRSEAIAGELAVLKAACADLGIEQERWGGRQHYLRWENPTTWRAWDEAGLDYDCSLGFPDRIGFRTGACVEHPVFDIAARRQLRLRERPLVVMDVGLERNARSERVAEEVLLDDVREQCRKVGGGLSVLWHNHSLLTSRSRALYRRAVLG